MKKRSWMPNDQNIKIDTLARMILEEANKQGLTIRDIRTACERCERYVLDQVVPTDENNDVSQYL